MSSRSISRTRSGCSSSVRNRSARESKPRRATTPQPAARRAGPSAAAEFRRLAHGVARNVGGRRGTVCQAFKIRDTGTNLGPTRRARRETSSTIWLPRRTPVRRQDLQKRLPTPPGGQGERAQAGSRRSSLVRTQSAEGRQATALSERRREPAAQVSGGVAALTCTSERPHNPPVFGESAF